MLGTRAEPLFDSLAALASQVCGTPVALLSLIDADRQWFKANELPPVPVHLVYPAGRTAAAKVRLFVQFAAERLRQVEVLRGRDWRGRRRGEERRCEQLDVWHAAPSATLARCAQLKSTLGSIPLVLQLVSLARYSHY
ncbi:MAG: hypothetical protein KA766_13585 [Piscinibacter sp.]|uniref:hypothetical protein n=1 Tax=Piscinibacter sp. TaxID=1903157 RepID=UPI001B493F81|nr:hypothetical protein [Piscinibacter sp.]MBP6028122.1 hypothetical protein [Piscinibacter sp.]